VLRPSGDVRVNDDDDGDCLARGARVKQPVHRLAQLHRAGLLGHALQDFLPDLAELRRLGVAVRQHLILPCASWMRQLTFSSAWGTSLVFTFSCASNMVCRLHTKKFELSRVSAQPWKSVRQLLPCTSWMIQSTSL